MVDILHRVAIAQTAPAKVYDALTTIAGLSGWWTSDTTGDAGEGGVIEFRFPPGGFDIKVVETTPAEHVRWQVVDGPGEWVGTTIDWRLRADDDWTVVMFQHLVVRLRDTAAVRRPASRRASLSALGAARCALAPPPCPTGARRRTVTRAISQTHH